MAEVIADEYVFGLEGHWWCDVLDGHGRRCLVHWPRVVDVCYEPYVVQGGDARVTVRYPHGQTTTAYYGNDDDLAIAVYERLRDLWMMSAT